ncbi:MULTISPECIES: MjaI family restriction endonuclease [Sporosarcina]|uniref:MjaI family restriction endonuclease n=1 Tax=Sporosarcina contaminans TaxID=633403 RepID=A0ABW3TXG6_9BACL
MKKISSINKDYIASANDTEKKVFPKYTTQLINLANSNAHGTRPKVVGSMADYFPLYLEETDDPTVEGWKNWYTNKEPEAKARAKARILPQVERLKEAIDLIDEQLIDQWLDDILIDKTFNGMYFQKAILQKLSEHFELPYRPSSVEEESKGIDGYIGSTPISIKPETYELMKQLGEQIEASIVTYRKNSSGGVDIFIEEDLNPHA